MTDWNDKKFREKKAKKATNKELNKAVIMYEMICDTCGKAISQRNPDHCLCGPFDYGRNKPKL